MAANSTRLGNVIRGLSASYAAMGMTIVYSLASVPLALRYLSVDEFGLWNLMVQISGYFVLIELGMTGAVARILIDHKDHHDPSRYGATVATGLLVFMVQGAIVGVAGFLLAAPLGAAFGIPQETRTLFQTLLVLVAGNTALGIATRIFSSVLYAHQRLDVLHLTSGTGLLFNLGLMWAGFALGLGIYALPVSLFAATAFGVSWNAWSCWRRNLLPARQFLRPGRALFGELFLLGKDIFLLNFGWQLLSASQIMIVSRSMGLEAAAVWAVSSKLFTLALQMVANIWGSSVVVLSEMIARGETVRLRRRLQQLCMLVAGVAAVVSVTVAGINQSFLVVWTGSSLTWGAGNDVLMAVVVFLNGLMRCHTDFVAHTKQVRGMRYVFFIEGVAFVALALWAAPIFGFTGVLAVSILCCLLFRCLYAVRRTASYVEEPVWQIVWGWNRRAVGGAAAAAALVLWNPFNLWSASPWGHFLATSLWCGAAACFALGVVALPADLRAELLKRLPFKR